MSLINDPHSRRSPGVLIYLMDNHRMDARAIEDLVYGKSGLLGVSGISSDMRSLRASPEPAAAEAIALFVYRIVREIGSLTAAPSGLYGLVFTGGIGENDAAMRSEVPRAANGWAFGSTRRETPGQGSAPMLFHIRMRGPHGPGADDGAPHLCRSWIGLR